MTDPFFVTGMFRSGTTLIARMLNTHSLATCASDPLFELFKSFRNHVLFEEFGGLPEDRSAPLEDYYFDSDAIDRFRRIQNHNLEAKIKHVDLDQLRERIINWSEPFSPIFAEHVDNLNGSTYRELIENGLVLVEDCYGNSDTTRVGFKDVWTGEFTSHLMNSFPEMKVIHVIRDPRAVCASNYVSGDHRYPFLFLCRQWRKLASCAIRDAVLGKPNLKERTKLVHYEKLVREPKQTIHSLCEFLDLPFEENLLDPGNYRNGAGEPWIQNTNYEDGESKFNTEAVDRWKQTLSTEQIHYIECLTHYEREYFNYDRNSLRELFPLDYFRDRPEISKANLADWIVPYVNINSNVTRREYGLEHLRYETMQNPNKIPEDFQKNLVLIEDLWDLLVSKKED